MKNQTTRITLGATLLLACNFAWSSDVTIPNTFSSGTPAVAGEVNSNFTAVKTAVDDNDARITIVENNKQNRVTGTCGIGSSIRTINSDGSVVCQTDADSGGTITELTAGGGLTGGGASGVVSLQLNDGYVSVHSSSLQGGNPTTCIGIYGPGFYWSTTSTTPNCFAVAGLNLPHGATLSGISCRLWDSDANGLSYVRLAASSLATGNVQVLYTTTSTVDGGGQTVSTLTISDPSMATINNELYAYYLIWNSTHNATTVGSNAAFYSCSIGYVY